ncbi:Uncharacterised protein [Mycobacteroides abscessus subsp. abscessus]|nr:Uncharacterised protein [Mycobacteroides abscessus subsp. abscessus]
MSVLEVWGVLDWRPVVLLGSRLVVRRGGWLRLPGQSDQWGCRPFAVSPGCFGSAVSARRAGWQDSVAAAGQAGPVAADSVVPVAARLVVAVPAAPAAVVPAARAAARQDFVVLVRAAAELEEPAARVPVVSVLEREVVRRVARARSWATVLRVRRAGQRSAGPCLFAESADRPGQGFRCKSRSPSFGLAAAD